MNYEPIKPKTAEADIAPAAPVRVSLGPPDDPTYASVLVTRGEFDTLKLVHPYPGLHPLPGWLVKGRNLSAVVKSVSGRVLGV